MKNVCKLFICFLLLNFFANAQPSSWKVTGIGGGGTFWRPSINPGNDNEYYVHTEMGSFFHTKDFGNTYTEINFLQLSASDKSVIRFTNDTNILYAIGLTPANRFQLTVYKSINNGVTWTMIPCIANSTQWQVTETVVSLYVDYNNPNRIAFSTRDGLYFSGDGGITLQDLTQTSPWYQFVSGAFFDGTNIYLGTPSGVLVSTNGGTSFALAALTGIPANEDIISFAAAKQNNALRFFCITIPTGIYTTDDVYTMAGGLTGNFKGVYRLDYSTSTNWITKNNGLTISSTNCYPCDHMTWIGMAENDTSVAYLYGVNGNSEPTVAKITGGGNSWSHVYNITNNQNIFTGYMGYQGDPFQWYLGCSGMNVCASNANKVVLANMGSVYKTANGATTWEQGYVNPADQNAAGAPTPKHKPYRGIGIENTTNWFALWTDANNILGCLTDIGSIRTRDGGTHWAFNQYNFNTMYHAVKHPLSGNIYCGASDKHDMYASTTLQDQSIDAPSYSNGKLLMSNDTGYSWTVIHDFTRPVYWLAFDPNNSNRMYVSVVNHANGLGGIWVTNNLQNGSSSTWTQLSAPPRTEGHPANIVCLNDGKIVCTFSARMTDYSFTPPGKFTKSSGVFIYDPGNTSWTDVTEMNTMAWYCNDIYVDPNDATQNTWYVGVGSGWGGQDATNTGSPNDQGGLFKTINRGASWTKLMSCNAELSGGGGVFSCAINPNNANQMYITTIVDGLFICNNINSGSPTFTQVSSFQFGNPLRPLFNPYNSNELWVTTFGNGIHIGNINNNGVAEFAKNESVLVYPNPSNGKFTINCKEEIQSIEIVNMLGEKMNATLSSDQKSVALENAVKGIYFYKASAAKSMFSGKIIVE